MRGLVHDDPAIFSGASNKPFISLMGWNTKGQGIAPGYSSSTVNHALYQAGGSSHSS